MLWVWNWVRMIKLISKFVAKYTFFPHWSFTHSLSLSFSLVWFFFSKKFLKTKYPKMSYVWNYGALIETTNEKKKVTMKNHCTEHVFFFSFACECERECERVYVWPQKRQKPESYTPLAHSSFLFFWLVVCLFSSSSSSAHIHFFHVSCSLFSWCVRVII